ncbi:MAG: ABC transporter permease subunit [SAR324 cluster bacterium]|nr:ABC transporter permease subunit [SAR324 cluster bacterium]
MKKGPRFKPSAPLNTFWRDPDKRGVVYQVLIFSLVLWLGYKTFRTTLANMAAKGISSSFDFLNNEAGFGIDEALPIPLLRGGIAYFIFALAFGLMAVFLLARWRASRGKTIGESTPLVLLSLALIFFLPVLVLHATYDTIETETYTEASSYGSALIVGVLNTLKISVVGCILATVLGFLVGLARLSTNFLVNKLASAYVEVLRNIPLLLQIFFWYFAVLQTLPSVRQSLTWSNLFILNNRGVLLPSPHPTQWFATTLFLSFGVIAGIVLLARHAARVKNLTGRQVPVFLPSLALLAGVPGLAWWILGPPVTFTYPVLTGFNYEGGIALSPEYASLLFGLTVYTSAQIAEIVRGGIQAVPLGQWEAARSLGMNEWQLMRFVVTPQALRVIIPPLTSQYLNLTKNSSLGVSVAYPELVAVGGTAISQSGRAIEIIGLTMAVYLTISLLISLAMNWYNARAKLVER